MLATLAVPAALLTNPSLTQIAGAAGTVGTVEAEPTITPVAGVMRTVVKPKPVTRATVAKPKPVTPAQRHAELIASIESRDINSDARARSVTVVGLRSEWQHVAICEVGGNWSMVGPVYSGIGFLNSTWQEYGGEQFAPRGQRE